MPYHAALSDGRRKMLKLTFPPLSASLRRHDPFDILGAIFFIVYTGCRWSRLPMGYPPYRTVYCHYRCRSAKGYLAQTPRTPVLMKRHIAVDMNGYPLGMDMTTANVHDSKGAHRLISEVLSEYKQIAVIKADMGYRGAFRDMPPEDLGITLECVKSNYGSSGFVPVGGRRVVGRTFSWLRTNRRLMRNYGKHLRTAGYMTLFAMVFLLLRYFS